MRCSLIGIVSLAALIGCSDSAVSPHGTPVKKVATLTMHVTADTIECCQRSSATLTFRDTTGDTVFFSGSHTWSSSDSSVVFVTQTGEYTTAGEITRFGHAVISVTEYGLTAQHTIFVRPRVGRLVLSAIHNVRAIGSQDSLSATAFTPVGPAINGTPTGNAVVALADTFFYWTSSNPSAFVVDSKGVIKTVGNGEAVIRVAALGAMDSVRLRAVEPYHVTEVPQSAAAYLVRFTDRGDLLAWVGSQPVVYRYDSGSLSTLDSCTDARDMNGQGQVLCVVANNQLALWEDGKLTILSGFPARPNGCTPLRLNAAGDIAYIPMLMPDVISCDARTSSVMIWHHDGSLTQLPNQFGIPTSIPYFNDGGDVGIGASSGNYFVPAGATSGDGIAQLPAFDEYSSYFVVTAFNARGFAAGYYSSRWNPSAGRIWQLGSGLVDQWLPGPIYGLNEANQIIGNANGVVSPGFLGAINDPYIAFLTDLVPNGQWTIGNPLAINNRGMIVAKATSRTDGHAALVILTPGT